jgi:hypothetical protein
MFHIVIYWWYLNLFRHFGYYSRQSFSFYFWWWTLDYFSIFFIETAKIFKLSFFQNPVSFPECGFRNKGLSSRSQRYRGHFFVLFSESGKYLNICTSLIPMQAFCNCFEIFSVLKKNSNNEYSGIIDSKLRIKIYFYGTE